MTYTPKQLQTILHQHKLWLEDKSWGQAAAFSDADLRGVDFENTDLRMVIFSRCDLRSADFHGADLRHTDFTGSNVIGADFFDANIHKADFSGVNLHGANFGNNEIVQIGPIGSRNAMLVVKRFPDGEMEAMTGCFRGTLDDLASSVECEHADSPKFLRQYRTAIAYCRSVWEVTE